MHLPTMLFRPGSETEIWGIPLDTLVVDEHEVPDYLAAGWYSHPWEARDSLLTAPAHPEPAPEKPRRGRPPKAKETP